MATVPAEEHDRLGTLVPGSQQLKIGSPYFHNPTLRNFSPRVGLAWNPLSDRSTTIRAAFGQYDCLPLTSQFSLLSVISAPFNVQGSTTTVPVGSFPAGLYESLSAGGPRADFIQQNPKRIYVLQWNFMVERRAPRRHWLVEVGYAASHGVHLPLVVGDINTRCRLARRHTPGICLANATWKRSQTVACVGQCDRRNVGGFVNV